MIYRTLKGVEYDISSLPSEEQKLFSWMWEEYRSARTWTEFHQRTSQGIIEAAKAAKDLEWQNHPLYNIQLDLTANAGVKLGEMGSELSDMLLD